MSGAEKPAPQMLAESWGVDGSAPYPMGEYLKGNKMKKSHILGSLLGAAAVVGVVVYFVTGTKSASDIVDIYRIQHNAFYSGVLQCTDNPESATADDCGKLLSRFNIQASDNALWVEKLLSSSQRMALMKQACGTYPTGLANELSNPIVNTSGLTYADAQLLKQVSDGMQDIFDANFTANCNLLAKWKAN